MHHPAQPGHAASCQQAFRAATCGGSSRPGWLRGRGCCCCSPTPSRPSAPGRSRSRHHMQAIIATSVLSAPCGRYKTEHKPKHILSLCPRLPLPCTHPHTRTPCTHARARTHTHTSTRMRLLANALVSHGEREDLRANLPRSRDHRSCWRASGGRSGRWAARLRTRERGGTSQSTQHRSGGRARRVRNGRPAGTAQGSCAARRRRQCRRRRQQAGRQL